MGDKLGVVAAEVARGEPVKVKEVVGDEDTEREVEAVGDTLWAITPLGGTKMAAQRKNRKWCII